LVTADLKTLAEGRGALAAFLNLQGKVLALTRFYRRSSSLLIELHESNREKILHNLSRFVPAGDFDVRDVSETLSLLSLQGPGSEELLRALQSEAIPEGLYSSCESEINGIPVLLTRYPRLRTTGFDLFIQADKVTSVLKAVSDLIAQHDGRIVSSAAFDVARIEAGIPSEPAELSEQYILLETGLDEAVSYTKGCYLGQEIIARIHWRGQPAKKLKRLAIVADSVPSPGAELFAADGKRVGHLTSSARVPSTPESRIVALGYVHRYYLADGTTFSIMVDGNLIGSAQISTDN
jgi:aminomethyltransferase